MSVFDGVRDRRAAYAEPGKVRELKSRERALRGLIRKRRRKSKRRDIQSRALGNRVPRIARVTQANIHQRRGRPGVRVC